MMFDGKLQMCTDRLIREKILYVYAQELQHHLQYVATLPCESRKSQSIRCYNLTQ